MAVAAVAVHAPPNDATAFVAAASPEKIIFKLTIGINFVECFVLKRIESCMVLDLVDPSVNRYIYNIEIKTSHKTAVGTSVRGVCCGSRARVDNPRPLWIAHPAGPLGQRWHCIQALPVFTFVAVFH